MKLRVIAFAICLFSVAVPVSGSANEKTVFQTESLYHRIRVVEDGNQRAMRFDNNYYQTKVNINNPLTGHFDYVNLFFESFLFKPDIENALILGLGGGSTQRLFYHYQPGVKQLSVEIDQAVLDVAQKYFFVDTKETPVEISDARRFLRTSSEKWDLIIQDSYTSNAYGTFVPFHLATYEYFSIVKSHLTDDGVFAINVIGTVYGGESNRVITSIYKTMSEVFPQLYMFAANDAQNVVIVASQSDKRITNVELLKRAQELSTSTPKSFPGTFFNAAYQYKDVLPSGLSGAKFLTDDYAPTDNLLR